jgi:hypothetical protein
MLVRANFRYLPLFKNFFRVSGRRHDIASRAAAKPPRCERRTA